MAAEIIHEPFRVVDVARDNMCFFHALQRQLCIHGRSVTVFELHRAITQWIVNNWWHPCAVLPFPLTVGNMVSIMYDETIEREAYEMIHAEAEAGLSEELGDAVWGGAAEAYAAAQLFGCAVELYTLSYTREHGRRARTLRLQQRFEPTFVAPLQAVPGVHLLYSIQGTHYKSIERPVCNAAVGAGAAAAEVLSTSRATGPVLAPVSSPSPSHLPSLTPALSNVRRSRRLMERREALVAEARAASSTPRELVPTPVTPVVVAIPGSPPLRRSARLWQKMQKMQQDAL